MFWSLSKLFMVVVAFCMMVSLDTVAGQKYREEVQREGFRPKKIILQKCTDAFKQADSSHTVCWRNDRSKLVTGTVDDHNEWCTKQIRKFDSTKEVAGKYKMSDCKMLTSRAEAADERYNFLHGLYMEEAGVKNDPKSWLDTANSFLLWGTRKVVQGVTLGNIKKPEIPPGSVFSNARIAAITFCKAAKRSVCTNGDNSALVRTIERFETALEKVEHATNVVTKWYAEYDHATSFTIKALKVTKFAGYCAAVAAAGPLVTKASAAGATTFLGAKGATVAAGAGVATVVTATHGVADQVGRLKAGLNEDFAWRKVIQEAAVAGTLHIAGGSVWLTKGGKAVVRKIADRYVARIANSKTVKSIAKLAHDEKLAYLKHNLKYVGFKAAVEKVGTMAGGFSQSTRSELVNLVFSKMIGVSKGIIKGVIAGYNHFKNKPEACQKKDCFTKYVVKDLEKRIAVGKDEEFATLREQLTEILDSEIHRRSSDGSYGNELSSQSSLKDNKGSSGGLKKSPWSATQVERCTRNGGKCINQKIDSCVGEIVNNLCPGDYRWKCCVD